MISKKTTLVLGAGASIPYGFPSGRQLLIQIAVGLAEPGRSLFVLLRDLGITEAELTEFQRALEYSGQPSVDAFLEARPEFLNVGKLAIASTLIPHERPELFRRISAGPPRWYEYLFNRLGTRFHEYEQSQLRIVTLNYDRSLEYYLTTALRHAFCLSAEKAAEALAYVPIFHVYGLLAPLSADSAGRPFEPELTPDQIKRAAVGIRIMAEPRDEMDSSLEDARWAISDADVVCLFGFGFHPVNVERLDLKAVRPEQRFLATAYDLLDGERHRVSQLFSNPPLLGGFEQDVLTFMRSHPVFEDP